MCEPFTTRCSLAKLFVRARALVLASLVGGICTPAAAATAMAQPSVGQTAGCSIGVDNQTVLLNATFNTVARTAMPSSVTTTPAILASCSALTSQASGIYRWTLSAKSLSFAMIQGTTPSTVVNAVGRQFSLATTTLELNNGPPGYTAQSQTSASTTAVLSGLSAQLSAGQYRLSQAIDVQQEFCQWTGKKFNCQSDGNARHFTAFYTLNVIESPPPPPPPVVTPPVTGQGTAPAPQPGHGVKPSPLTVRGAAAKYRCAI